VRTLSQSTASSSVTDLSLPEADKMRPKPACASEAQPADVLHSFTKELHRVVAAVSTDDFNQDCFKELDHDLLLDPMDAFEQTLWGEATLPDPRVAQRETLEQPQIAQGRPGVDIPRNAESSAFSVYSPDVS
jgi:hypothetical protein